MAGTDEESVISTIASRDSLEIMEEPKINHDSKTARRRDFKVDPEKSLPHVWEPAPPPRDNRRDGLDEMVDFMKHSRGHRGTLFRRFDSVNIRYLLEMEREIGELEMERERLEQTRRSSGGRKLGGIESELREKVKEYYNAMLLTKEIMALSRPSKCTLNDARRAFPPDYGQSEWILNKFHSLEGMEDLSSLAPTGDSDAMTRIFERLAKGKNVAHCVTFVSVMCAVVFLVGAVVGLYYVASQKARLGMVGTFTVLFAATIAVLTNTRKHEVFVATAAYAAVLVVFVSGNISVKQEPTVCVLSTDDSKSAVASALNAAATVSTSGQAATITQTAVQTVTSLVSGSAVTFVSTVVSTALTSPTTVVVKKQEMNDLTKAGIGVGVFVGVLFCFMVLSGAVIWARQKNWSSLLSALTWSAKTNNAKRTTERTFRLERDQRADRKPGGTEAQKTSQVNAAKEGKEKGKEKAAAAKTKSEHVAWV